MINWDRRITIVPNFDTMHIKGPNKESVEMLNEIAIKVDRRHSSSCTHRLYTHKR